MYHFRVIKERIFYTHCFMEPTIFVSPKDRQSTFHWSPSYVSSTAKGKLPISLAAATINTNIPRRFRCAAPAISREPMVNIAINFMETHVSPALSARNDLLSIALEETVAGCYLSVSASNNHQPCVNEKPNKKSGQTEENKKGKKEK